MEEVDRRYWADGLCDGCQVAEYSTPAAVQDLLEETSSLSFSLLYNNAQRLSAFSHRILTHKPTIVLCLF